jgi:hypothetical protein
MCRLFKGNALQNHPALAVHRYELLSVPMGLLSGLEAQSEICELLDELYADGLR